MSADQISIIIVEDEPEFRRRFAQIIENEPTMRLAGVAANKREAQALIDREEFDVMLIDLGLPDGTGIDLIRSVSQRKPDVDIMVVTVFGDEQHVVSSIEAGATGYILKDSTPADVISCIRLLRAGGSPVSPVVARSVLRAIRSRMKRTGSASVMGSTIVTPAGTSTAQRIESPWRARNRKAASGTPSTIATMPATTCPDASSSGPVAIPAATIVLLSPGCCTTSGSSCCSAAHPRRRGKRY